MKLLDLFDRNIFGHVDGLGNGARDERLHSTHHADVTAVMDGVVAHRAGEHWNVFGLDVWRTKDRHVLVDVGNDFFDLRIGVTELGEGTRNRLVDDRHGAAANKLLHLDQTKVGLNTGGVAIHHEADGAGRCKHRCLRVTHTNFSGEFTCGVP
ncbi:unannotated protein [freshwater metagenome]|uniref:Unannotated protein n=1 Tax=freshwater metagenome TaxID=449393 RepID=A0A6J6JH87_9ZZZZ